MTRSWIALLPIAVLIASSCGPPSPGDLSAPRDALFSPVDLPVDLTIGRTDLGAVDQSATSDSAPLADLAPVDQSANVDQAPPPPPDLLISFDIAQRVDAAPAHDLALQSFDLEGADFATQKCQFFGLATSIPLLTSTSSLAVADMNGDGHLDIVTYGAAPGPPGTSGVAVLLGDGHGNFKATNYPGPLSPVGSLGLGDLNGDQRPDVVISSGLDVGALSVFLNHGDGTLDALVSYPSGEWPESVSLADFDGDGHLDVICAIDDSPQKMPPMMQLWHGLGKGQLAMPPTAIPLQGIFPDTVAVGDFNGDGHIDFVTGVMDQMFMAGFGLEEHLGDGKLGFALSRFLPLDPWPIGFASPEQLLAVDINRDQRLDVLYSDSVNLFAKLGRGDGSFGPSVVFPGAVYFIATGDVNNDGSIDVIGMDNLGNALVILPGRGNGTFDGPILCPGGDGPSNPAIGDFNEDGKPDVVGINLNAASLVLFLHQ